MRRPATRTRRAWRCWREGRAEEGLAKLEEASRAAPDNLSYRADLVRSREQTVSRLLAAADSERAAGRPAAAQAMYERVLGIDPGNSRAVLGLEMLQMDARHEAALNGAEALLKKRDIEAARAALKPVLLENPKNGKALLLQRKINEQVAKETLAEPSLKAKFTKPVTLQFRDANLKMVFEALSRTSGINVLLDRDVKPDLKTSIFVKDVSVEDTINLILLQNQLEKKVISDNTVFIYPATAGQAQGLPGPEDQELSPDQCRPQADADHDQDAAEDQGHLHSREDQFHRDARHARRDPAGGKNGRRPGHRPSRKSCWKWKCWK